MLELIIAFSLGTCFGVIVGGLMAAAKTRDPKTNPQAAQTRKK